MTAGSPGNVGAEMPKKTSEARLVAASAVASIVPSLPKYSAEARSEHGATVTEYFVDLERLSRIIAKQKQSDDVQASHVRLAAEALGKGEPLKRFRRMAEVGAVLGGAGLGYLGNVILAEEYTFGNALVFGIPILVGIALYFYAIGQA